jgi:hypothetical protein
MARAKPAYDTDGSWKSKDFSPEEWDAITVALQQKLRPYSPDENPPVDEIFGHPADEFANVLLAAAVSGSTAMLYIRRRLTNEQLRAELKDLLRKLERAEKGLSRLAIDSGINVGSKVTVRACIRHLTICVEFLGKASLDLNSLLDPDGGLLDGRDKLERAAIDLAACLDNPGRSRNCEADLSGCGDVIVFLKRHLEKASLQIANTRRAAKIADAQHDAAVEMAVRVLHALKGYGVPLSATAGAYDGHTSIAVKILKIIGDKLRLRLAETTWRDKIRAARESSPSLTAT